MLDPLHPAASIVEKARNEGFVIQRLLSFTRRSTIVAVGAEHNPEVIKIFFGSDHVLDALPIERRSSAYGFYWYASKSPEERAYERAAVSAEIEITAAMSGNVGWPRFLDSGSLG